MPNTSNRALNTPDTGSLVGSWGTTAVNNNMSVIDGILGGVVSVSLTNVNVTLGISTGSIGTGSITPGAGPVQADNAVVRFTGTLTGNCVITFPCPGFWIVENNCVVSTAYVQARATGTGNMVGLPPGEPCHIYCDGTDVKFVNMGRVGEFVDLAVASTPAWVSACSIKPYLVCDGSVYSSSIATALSTMLGSTFGGNGVSTFGVPDLGNRVRLPIGSRITSGSGGFNGAIMGVTGGVATQTISTSNLPASLPYTDPGHTHTTPADSASQYASGATAAVQKLAGTLTNSVSTTNITINPGSPNTPLGVVQPSLVFGLTFVKT